MIDDMDRSAFRELFQLAPARSPSPLGSARFGEAIADWLVEAGLPEGRSAEASGDPVSVVVVGQDEGRVVEVFAVPDREIDAALREALDAPWSRVFALEEICAGGPLWIVTLCGIADQRAVEWLAPHVGLDVATVWGARGRWAPYALSSVSALRAAIVTRCYAARLAG